MERCSIGNKFHDLWSEDYGAARSSFIQQMIASKGECKGTRLKDVATRRIEKLRAGADRQRLGICAMEDTFPNLTRRSTATNP